MTPALDKCPSPSLAQILGFFIFLILESGLMPTIHFDPVPQNKCLGANLAKYSIYVPSPPACMDFNPFPFWAMINVLANLD